MIGYLGKSTEQHSVNLRYLLQSVGENLQIIPDSLSAGVYERVPRPVSWKPVALAWKRGHRLVSQLHRTEHRGYVDGVIREIDRSGIDCIIAFWGIQPIPDIAAIKKYRPETKIILNVLCHPTAISRTRAGAQDWFLRRAMKYCDGLILSGRLMKAYFESRILRGRSVPVLIWPPYLSRRFHALRRLTECSTIPSALFLGRMDWSRAQASDNVRASLLELMNEGINIYYDNSPEGRGLHRLGHAFAYRPLAEILLYATQFDAAVVMYNLSACECTDRFDVTVPERLVSSVAAGIPVAIPRSGYDACKEYLKSYRAVIEFTSMKELAVRLGARDEVKELKQMAQEDRANYEGECNLRPLLEFISDVMNQDGHAFLAVR